jgi:hypothetical protein
MVTLAGVRQRDVMRRLGPFGVVGGGMVVHRLHHFETAIVILGVDQLRGHAEQFGELTQIVAGAASAGLRLFGPCVEGFLGRHRRSPFLAHVVTKRVPAAAARMDNGAGSRRAPTERPTERGRRPAAEVRRSTR